MSQFFEFETSREERGERERERDDGKSVDRPAKYGQHVAPSVFMSETPITKPVRAAYTADPGPGMRNNQSTTIIVNQPIIRPRPVQMIETAHPEHMICFNCEQEAMTYIYYEAGNCSYMACIGLACIGCDLGCCFIPFFCDRFKDIVHKCPRCHIVVGRHKRC